MNRIKNNSMSKNQDKSINYSKKFKFKDTKLIYEFQLKKKRNWWWLLLCLLPLLLFVKCERDITVKVFSAESGAPIEGVNVEMDYVAHYLYHDSTFFCHDYISESQFTDSLGIARFEKLGCSVYSYVFYFLSRVSFRFSSDCYVGDECKRLFHFTRIVKKKLQPELHDVMIRVIDGETGQPIAGASVNYENISDKQVTGNGVTNPNGELLIEKLNVCGQMKSLSATALGYADTVLTNIANADMIANQDARTIKLRPLKEKIDFFVKNKFTRQPVPGAKAVITLMDRGTSKSRNVTTTNVDGKGHGVYEEAFVLAKVQIQASKLHFKDGELEGDYTVEQFKELPDSLRVIYLEPEPYVRDFVNIDTISNKPIPGVTNNIVVRSINGKIESYQEISNRSGYFPVKAMEGDEISIVSTCQPVYRDKNTKISSFKDAEIVYMHPNVVDLHFRTFDAIDGSLLGDCNLRVFLNKQYVARPNNSGSGEFVVKNLYVNGNLSITASKDGYKTNDYTISGEDVMRLMQAPQQERDIPLDLDLPPCQAGNLINSTQGQGYHKTSYSLGKKGDGANTYFEFDYKSYEVHTDRFVVYNCKEDEIDQYSPIFDSGHVLTGDRYATKRILFVQPVVTVVVEMSDDQNSSWDYCVHCPE